MSTHRDAIIRKTRLYQVLVILFVGCAAAIIALPVSRLFSPGSAKPVTVVTPTVDANPPANKQVDTEHAATVIKTLGMYSPHATPADPQPDATTTPVVKVSHDWTFSGSMVSADKRSAIVKVDGQQHLLREGEVLGDTTLVSVEPDAITIRAGRDERRIALQARSSSWPTEPPKRGIPGRAPGTLPGAPGAAGAAQPGMPNATPVPNTLENRGNPPGAKPKPGGPRSSIDPTNLQPGQEKLDPAHRDTIVRQLQQPDLPQNFKVQALRQLGISSGMDQKTATARLREFGLDAGSDASLGEALKVTIGGPQ